ncbi:sperm flagellar protein 1 [Episyrphus balteatus]|uniref:sperm flagellar protein 1 n=1 Tax=Episyrphus balteatus TaxID=286459 RepID=UPI0024857200|nr:sperm flagellar protein 1 [Episyrphus balteatus]
MSKKLTENQLQELQNWLNKFSLNKIFVANKLHRDLSDGVIVAMMLKEMYPKLIDLHNYSSSSSVQLKRTNWETLNNKVFKKLGIQQNSNILDSISRSISGFIEKLLFTIMRNEEASAQKIKFQLQEEDDLPYAMNDEIVMINMNKQIGDGIIQVPQKMILYSIFEQTFRASKEKDIKIDLLYQKNVHLENLIELKNERIEELQGQIEKLQSVRKLASEESLNVSEPSSTLFKIE